MAVRSGLGRNKNIFTASRQEKIAEQAPLDFDAYNKRAKEKRDVEANRQATLQSFATQGLPEAMQSNLRGQYEAINKAVSEGLDVNSSEYLSMEAQLKGDTQTAKGFWDNSIAKAKEVSKDPSKFRGTTLNEAGNPMYTSVEDGLTNYYSEMNTASDPNLSMAQILAGASGSEQDAMVGYNDFDEKALIDSADQVFMSSMTESFDLEPSDVAGLATATENKVLYGEARERAKLAWMKVNQNALKTMALNNGAKNDYSFQSKIADEMIKESEQKITVKTHRTRAQEAKTRADTRKINKELEVQVLEGEVIGADNLESSIASAEKVLGVSLSHPSNDKNWDDKSDAEKKAAEKNWEDNRKEILTITDTLANDHYSLPITGLKKPLKLEDGTTIDAGSIVKSPNGDYHIMYTEKEKQVVTEGETDDRRVTTLLGSKPKMKKVSEAFIKRMAQAEGVNVDSLIGWKAPNKSKKEVDYSNKKEGDTWSSDGFSYKVVNGKVLRKKN